MPDPTVPAPERAQAVSPEELDRALTQYARLPTFPLAVSWLGPAAPVPPKLKRPKKDLGIQVAICQTFALARRYGWGLAVGREDLSCPLAAVAFGYEKSLPFYEQGNLCVEMYTKDAAAGARSEAAIPKFEHGHHELLCIAPLARATFAPDVVLVYANGAQVMRLLAAALYRRGGTITSHHAARVDCAELVVRTHRTQEPQVVLPCYGDRIFGQTGDDEMAFAWPASWNEELLEGLAGTHAGGVRYPVPSFLRYTGDFPATYEKLKTMWQEPE
ncbi:MAG: DUF169 domain-containing protein [Candidatus Eiseniibacteriota bacterium]